MSGYVGWSLPANTLQLINADIGPSPNVIWVSLAWTLSLAIGYALIGRMSDIFGRRYFFITTTGLALIGSIVAATANGVITSYAQTSSSGSAHLGSCPFPLFWAS